jgi:hypothetical protein
MPVVKSLMTSLRTRYGAKKGERIYYGMEAEGKGPFAKGNKHHDLHVAYAAKLGVKPIERTKKTPRPKSRGLKRRA